MKHTLFLILLVTSQFTYAQCTKEQEVTLFALNMYHEARGEGIPGMAAVGQVVIQRMKSGRYPNDVCSVIRQYRGGVCHFSWLCDGRSNTPTNRNSWFTALALSEAMLHHGYRSYAVSGATMYYACTSVWPPRSWNWRKLTLVRKMGNHCFFKENVS